MPNPDLIPEPFAQSGNKNPIPLERATSDPVYRASWKAGFPPDTRLPKDLGGEAPDGLDFNGVLNIISQAVVFLQKGNAYQFDAIMAPYPIGALVRSNDNLTTYQSTVPNNSNNPNSNMTGWRVYNSSSFVVDNLTTKDSAKALSAAQGKVLQDNKLESNKVGAANGVASLDANTKVPVAQLPDATTSQKGVARFATNTEAQTGAKVSAAITPDQATMASFGFGQTWRDVTNERFSVKWWDGFTNTTGKPIIVTILFKGMAGITVNDIQVDMQGLSDSTSRSVSAVVPAGAKYYLNLISSNAGDLSHTKVLELR